MRKRLAGALAVGALFLGGVARGDEGAGGGSREGRELSGRFVGSDSSTLYLEHMGAVVPIEIARGTSFSGVRSAADLVGGEEVRVSFVVERTKNVARGVSLGPAPSAEARRIVGDDPYGRGGDFGG